MICFIPPVSGLGGTRNSQTCQVSGFRILRYSYCRWEMCSPLNLRDIESRRPLDQLFKTLQLASFGPNGAAALHRKCSSFSFPVRVISSVLRRKTIFSLFDSYSFGHFWSYAQTVDSLAAFWHSSLLSCSSNPVVTPNPLCLQIICQTWWAFAFRCCRVFSFWSQSSFVKHWPSSMLESSSLLGLAKINTDTRVGAHF